MHALGPVFVRHGPLGVSDPSALILALAALVGSMGTGMAAVITAIRAGRHARRAADAAVELRSDQAEIRSALGQLGVELSAHYSRLEPTYRRLGEALDRNTEELHRRDGA